MRTHTAPHPHLPEDLCASIAAYTREPDHRFSRLSAPDSPSPVREASAPRAAAMQPAAMQPAPAPFRPALRTPLLLTALSKAEAARTRPSDEIMQGRMGTTQAKLLAAYTSCTACRLEFIKAFSFDAIQGYKHARHILRHGVKQAYKKVMEDIRRYDVFTARLYRESVDYFDDLTEHYNAELRELLSLARLHTYLLLKQALPNMQRRPTPDQLHLLADLFLARTLMDLTFTRAEEEAAEMFRTEGVDVSFMFNFYLVRLHKDLAELYARTSDALAGDVSGVPLLEGSEREELENVMQLLLRKLMSLSFSTRMVNDLTEARNASSGEG